MIDKIKKYAYYIFSVLLLVSAACYITEWSFIPYVYAVSAIILAVIIATNVYNGNSFRLKRLNTISIISSALLLPMSVYCMFEGRSDWIACLTLFALLQLYVIFTTDREEKREKENEKWMKNEK